MGSIHWSDAGVRDDFKLGHRYRRDGRGASKQAPATLVDRNKSLSQYVRIEPMDGLKCWVLHEEEMKWLLNKKAHM